jgi:hypothetical protein
MVKRSWPPSQGWRTFLRNHSPDIAAMDLFVAPTLGFDLLYAFIIVRLARRDLVWINVTPHPTADWIARQITEAFAWNDPRATSSAIAIRSTALPSGIDCEPWASAGSADRVHHVACAPGRTASPLHARLSFRYTQGLEADRPHSRSALRRPQGWATAGARC